MPAPADHDDAASRRPTAAPRQRDAATLAALVVAAMPDVRPVAFAPAEASRDDIDVAVVHDDQSRVWVVVAPRTAAAGAKLEAETEAVRLLAGVLPFDVPRPRADVALRDNGRAIVYPAPRGRPVDLTRLAAAPAVCSSVGRSLAALHDVTTAVVERAGVPVYDAGEVRRRRLSELDRGAETGQVPPVLLQRWEAMLEESSAWDFASTVVHGDLVAERMVVTENEVTAVLDWTDVHVGDPAEDLAWLAVGAEPETVDAVMEAYRSSRHGSVDENLVRRAVLHGEMALVRWLLHGVSSGSPSVQDDARRMLEQLASWVEAEDEARRSEAERKRAEAERAEQERAEAERAEQERAEAERAEQQRIEQERAEAERSEQERAEQERAEQERAEAASIEAERVEAERVEAERVEAERVEAERVEAERAEAASVEAPTGSPDEPSDEPMGEPDDPEQPGHGAGRDTEPGSDVSPGVDPQPSGQPATDDATSGGQQSEQPEQPEQSEQPATTGGAETAPDTDDRER